MRHLIAAIVLALAVVPIGAAAQDTQTLADIRQELSVLSVEMKKLRRELNTTGSPGEPSGGGSILDRVNAIESEVQRLTGKTEELEFRIERVVQDGTNRLGDLEFRLCEMEPGCDISNFEPGSTLGGDAASAPDGTGMISPPSAPAGPEDGGEADGSDAGGSNAGGDDAGPQLAVGERDDFERAQAAFEAGDYERAAEQFAAFLQDYPGGPLSGRAGLMRGAALDRLDRKSDAARAYLETFSAAPSGDEAPEALFRLGRALGQLGQTEDACVTLAQVAERYPGSGAVSEAQAEMERLGCS
ncbi:MAG: tol-pal system protein YbgF [Pseudomonadota bacterium]